MVELDEGGFGLLQLGLEAADALADKDRIDPGLDRGELALQALVDRGKLVFETLSFGGGVPPGLAAECLVLSAEGGEALGSEDAGGEEAVDADGDLVFADVLPFAVSERLGGVVAVGEAVAAGVVGVAFRVLPCMRSGLWPVAQWTMPRSR